MLLWGSESLETPALVPGLFAWYDAADHETIFSRGGKIWQWNDKSVHGHHAYQDNASNQPTTGVDTLNGLNVITNAIGEGFYILSSFLSITQGDCTVFAIAPRTGTDTLLGNIVSVTQNGTAWTLLRYSTNPGAISYQFGTVATNLTSNTNSDPIIYTAFREDTSISLQRNNGTTSSNSGATSTSTVNLTGLMMAGNATVGLSAVDGYAAEIIFYNRKLSSDEITLVKNYLSVKWAISI